MAVAVGMGVVVAESSHISRHQILFMVYAGGWKRLSEDVPVIGYERKNIISSRSQHWQKNGVICSAIIQQVHHPRGIPQTELPVVISLKY